MVEWSVITVANNFARKTTVDDRSSVCEWLRCYDLWKRKNKANIIFYQYNMKTLYFLVRFQTFTMIMEIGREELQQNLFHPNNRLIIHVDTLLHRKRTQQIPLWGHSHCRAVNENLVEFIAINLREQTNFVLSWLWLIRGTLYVHLDWILWTF